jgi:Na+-transporting methylmalonyl-CoA/oxaloacetate decarboxylase gamma subunit
MKKLFKLFTLAIVLFSTALLTGCTKEDQFTTIKNPITDAEVIAKIKLELLNANKEETVIGLYDKSNDALYIGLASLTLQDGDYYVVTGKLNELPSMEKKGANFSGWYTTAEFKSGTKVTSGDAQTVLYAKYMTFAEAGIVAVVCMAIVFGMLALIAGIIALFKFVAPKEEEKQVVKPTTPQVVAARPALKLEDIKDEDMMAAALVATIDYHEETKEDVRVVSIKQIG